MMLLRFALLVISGFTACSEFGSYAFVHPVIRRLPPTYHIQVEQGLLRTFGRIMPLLMTATTTLSLIYAFGGAGLTTTESTFRWLAAGANTAALISTIIFNVPINLATGRWDANHPPDDWKATRNRWEVFQGLRSWLYLAGFVLLCVAVTQ
jgi:uncharacterized membrane protein